MPAPFAKLEKRVTDAVKNKLANKTFTINGVAVDGVFMDDYTDIDMVESSNPVFIARTEDLPAIAHGMKLDDADGNRYEVVGVKPDGGGMTQLELRVEWLT